MTEAPPKKRGFFGRLFGGDTKPSTPPLAEQPANPSPDTADEAEISATSDAAISVPPPRPIDATPPLPVIETARAEPITRPEPPAEPAAKPGWFSRLKAGLTKTSSKLSEGITSLFTKRKLDASTLEDLEDLLIQSDLGVDTAMRITATLSKGRYEKGILPEDVKNVLADEVQRVLTPVAKPLVISGQHKPHVILVVGVNGTGKTTTIGKFAQQFRREGKTVMLAAGDTFRAAAIDQLKVWGERTGAPVISRAVGSDASGLAFDALKDARIGGHDVLIIDTAGRLQNKQALMEELEKVLRVIKKIDPSAPHDVVLVLDATTGQNALSQVDVFQKRSGVTGLVMTKLDGTARGGILVAIADKYKLPVHAIGVGEGVEDLQPFDPEEFARAIALG
jgi:fused signal recognition particle receptor